MSESRALWWFLVTLDRKPAFPGSNLESCVSARHRSFSSSTNLCEGKTPVKLLKDHTKSHSLAEKPDISKLVRVGERLGLTLS